MFMESNLYLPAYKNLDIQHLSRLFDNMSECYKIFWFHAILDSVVAGKKEVTYDDLINNMIADAWYMVSEYRHYIVFVVIRDTVVVFGR